MSDYTLYIGNRAYSSWSLRGWLACTIAEIEFETVLIPLYQPDTRTRYRAISPGGKVPALHHGTRVVWESIAICHYLAEQKPALPLWPRDPDARAWAFSIAAEMHAGFVELRRAMFMNVRKRFPGRGRTPGALADIARIVEIWHDTRARFAGGGPFLMGDRLSLVDCMYAPVAARFRIWEPELPDEARAYVDAVWSHPAMRAWVEAAQAEPWTNEAFDNPA